MSEQSIPPLHATILMFASVVAPIAILIMILIFANLSKRLGAVTRATPNYRWFYVSAILIGLGALYRLFSAISKLDNPVSALLYDIPYGLGILLGVVIAWQYWGWLLSERER